MKTARALVLGVLLFAGPGLGSALAAPQTFADPALEARTHHLLRQLRCPVCQGESLDESQAPLAADLRTLVRAHIAAGDSDAQIEKFLVARYGDFILMDPPFQANTYLLWLAPFAVLLLGGGVAFWVIRRAAKSPQ
jgi:cytochrome c-type biogenesis protein CcmH